MANARPDLDALAALLAKATPGPWDAPNGETMIDRVGTEDPVADAYHYEDAALIVAAVNALPALIARVRELEQERNEALAGMFDGLNHAGALVGRIADEAEEAARAAAIAMRERCAQACEELSLRYDGAESEASSRVYADLCRGSRNGADACAAAIRALEV